MARNKCFNREDALQKAMTAFWSQGYEATSIQDLVDCMGINRGSLYDTFGDKHSLFLAALDQYTETSVTRSSALQRDGNAKQILTEFLQAFMLRNIEDKDRRGCFITNTAIERSSHDEDCATRIRNYFSSVEKDLEQLIARGQAAGEIKTSRDSATLAAFFIGVMQGIRVVAKVNPTEEYLRPLVDVALASIDG
ncbi:TetR/AcrR family transcriptional regulator [Sneathiella aquimaris]|uniref:TetR/AcrR family transcriptional regulator n=1 Tax=Sneathiella aquimaris TaxID=2599305 RepID=UPI00146D9675|nr:TetR/AcrR family transcriptional regulator [Sneathiella aquimaris]